MGSGKEADSTSYFFVSDGTVLKNKGHLKSFLSTCSHATFSNHVNNEKNDFFNWVRDVFLDKELAERIKKKNDSKEMLYAIEEYDREKHVGNYTKKDVKNILKQRDVIKDALALKNAKKMEEIKKAENSKKAQKIPKSAKQIQKIENPKGDTL